MNHEKHLAEQGRAKAERLLDQQLRRHEDEVRTRIDFEVKINKLYNTNVAMENHQTTLEGKIFELEHLVSSLKENGMK